MLDHFLPPSLLRLQSEREHTGKRYWLGQNPGKYPFARRTLELAGQKGQGLVELAIVIPFLVMVVIGVLDLGRMYFTVITINNAAREGARYLMQHPDDKSTVDICPFYIGAFSGTVCAAVMEARYATPRIVDLDPANDVDVTKCDDDLGGSADGICDSEEPISVMVTYDFEPILWPGTLTFSRSVEMLVP